MLVPLTMLSGLSLADATVSASPEEVVGHSPTAAKEPENAWEPVPVGNISEWINKDDFPDVVKNNRNDIITLISLKISSDGTVNDCAIDITTASYKHNATLCQILSARARFHPMNIPLSAGKTDIFHASMNWGKRVIAQMLPPLDIPSTQMPNVLPGPEPLIRLDDLISVKDYPASSRRAGKEGAVKFRLDIDPTGFATACEITHPSDDTNLDSTTCNLITRRARFKPAVDAAGNPIAGIFLGVVHWHHLNSPNPNGGVETWVNINDYPTRSLQLGEEGDAGFELTINAGGKPTHCAITHSSGFERLDTQTCAIMMERAKFAPASPAKHTVTWTWHSNVRWRLPPG